MDGNVLVAGDLHGPQHEHLRPRRGHLEHLLVRHRVELARVRDDPWVRGEDAVDVRVDLARRAERGGERDCGGVRASTSERRHVHRVAREALVSGDEHDSTLVERLEDAHGRDLTDLRLRVHRVGDDPGLGAGERDRLVAQIVHGHRDEGARDPLAGREEHVELARVRLLGDLPGELEQPVGRVAHRRDGRDDANAARARLDQSLRDVLDLVGIGDRRAAELHDDGLRATAQRWHSSSGLWLVRHSERRAVRPRVMAGPTPAGVGPASASRWSARRAHDHVRDLLTGYVGYYRPGMRRQERRQEASLRRARSS